MKTNVLFLFISAFLIVACNNDKHPIVTTIAGNGILGFADGDAKSASFSNPMGVAVDSSGNVYVADSRNNLIRKITPDGKVSTLAGSGKQGSADGKGTAASFFFPTALATDVIGNVFVADTHNSLIRKITPDGTVTTFAGKPTKLINDIKDTAGMDHPSGIAVDKSGNVFVSDLNKDFIKKITLTGKVSILAGNGERGKKDGKGSMASFYLPAGLTLDDKGNLYVCDSYNNMIRKITPDGMVLTIAGRSKKGSKDGKDTAASFWHPNAVTVDKAGNLYVADMGNNKIRKITPDGMVTTFAGSNIHGAGNGHVTETSFYQPYGIATDKAGNLYIADYQNNLIRKISF
ncbi:MAG TPA: NHL repeat-containing protein [Mucilaginibacter sp.]|jgi:sugar lactone lactonase YvrE|nr:NHL repeat-containing protein [Mucilaginibacter sp.]